MSTFAMLEPEARAIFKEEWKKLQLQAATSSTTWPLKPLHWLLADFVEQVSESPSRPASEYRPMIRQRIREQSFVDECGDATISDDYDIAVEHHVEVFVRTLDRLRRHALACGRWSNEPASEIMFG